MSTENQRKTKVQLEVELEGLHQKVAQLEAVRAEGIAVREDQQSAQEYAETLIQSSLDMIIAVDKHRRIMEFNKAAERTFGYRKEEVLGQSIDLLYAHPSQGVEVYTTTVRSGDFNGEVLNRRKNGEVFETYLSASVLRNAKREAVGVMGISRDITARKALERQRTEMLTLLTHDIKSPLGGILACAELVLEGVQKRGLAEEEDLIERLRSNVFMIDALVTNYLDFSRIEAGHLTLLKRPVCLQDVVRRVGLQYKTEAHRKGLEFKVEELVRPVTVEGDALALGRVVTNLVDNAVKFTPEGGRVTIRMKQQPEDGVVEVCDTGNRIGAGELSLIFEKYRRVTGSRQRAGSGLGLYIVKALIEAQGGRVTVESTVGQGSCFSITVPLSPEV